MTRQRSAGRPAIARKLAKGSLLSVRFTEDERRMLDRAAGQGGLRLSEWARRALLAEAERGAGGSPGASER